MTKSKIFTIALGFTLVVICFLPILKSGLYSDDLPNFQLRASDQSQTVFQIALSEINYWKTTGRYTPLSFYWMEFVYKYFTTVASYKFLVFIINILAVIIFLIYLSKLKLNINYSIWLICFGAVIQYRITYHDAYTSLNSMYQLLSIIVFGTLIFYNYYLIQRKIWLLILSVICFISGILFSEIGLLALLLMPVSAIILKISFRNIIKSILPFAIIAIIYLGYIGWLRMHMHQKDVYIGLTTNIDLIAMLNLLFEQIYASLPLSNLTKHWGILKIITHQLSDVKNIFAVTTIIILAYFIYKRSSNSIQNKIQLSTYSYLLVSLSIIIFPALFILPSVKYQNEVKWGIGYLPVYFQNFGTATLLMFLFEYCFNNSRKLIQRCATYLMVFLVTGTCISFLFNNALINACSFNTSYPAQVFYEKIKDGTLQSCKNGSTIILGRNFFWKNPDIYQKIFKNITGKDFTVYDFDIKGPIDVNSDCYYLDCYTGKKIIISLYEFDKLNRNKKILILRSETPCDIELNEAEFKLFH
jgi:hypothetical protein